MTRTNFENLRVYTLSEELADLVWGIASGWDVFSRETIGKQIVRSADSIGANIAEGTGRYGRQDNKRFGYFARGSLYETKHWLRRAYKRKLLSEAEVEKLRPLIDELSPKLNAYISSIQPAARRLTSRATNNEPRTTN
ncbi:MAG TPA: four helix bundle protein [Pyrinomonadaceae bacterium]